MKNGICYFAYFLKVIFFSTWELEEDVPRQKLLDFRRRSEFDLFKLKEHPKISPKVCYHFF